MSQPRVLFYVQHLLGIGHLARASRVAQALVEDGFALTLVTGGAPVAGFPAAGLTEIKLPAIVAASQGFAGLADVKGKPVDEAFKTRRRDQLLTILADLKPDIVIIEAFPFGRRQMRFELMPLLEAIEDARPRPMLVTSIRDLLQERVKAGRNEETRDIVQRHFDLVLVHGDPRFAKLDETFPFAREIGEKVAYTGLVAGPVPGPASERFDVLVSAGGGAAGAGLIKATVSASALDGSGRKWALITGPNLRQAEYDAALAGKSPDLSIFRFRPDFPNLLAGAQLSVSQAGYNTVCDLLRAGCRSLLVPFAAGGETEQTARAARLSEMGLASVVEEKDLDGPRLLEAVESALAKPKPPANSLDLDGAKRSAQILRQQLAGIRA